MSTPHDYEVLVVGTGPAGQRAAIAAAKLNRSVAIIDRRQFLGGVCVNTGTIPSKTLREAIMYLSGYRLRSIYGIDYRVKDQITMADLTMRTNQVVRHEMQVIHAQMARNGVKVIVGEGRFEDPHTMLVEDAERGIVRVTAEKIILAPGTEPAHPENVPLKDKSIIDSDGVLNIEFIPKTMAVVGAGIIGLEYASMFATLGTKVTLLDSRPRLLEFVDDEVVDALTYHLRNQGVTFRLGEEVVTVESSPRGPTVCLASGKQMTTECLLFSTGRSGRTKQLNLQAAGIEADFRGRLKVNEHFQTEVPHIYAAGDVIGFPGLASTAMEQGRLAALHACGQPGTSLPGLYPYAIYAVPEISMVGRTEQELTAACVPFESGVANYREISRGQIIGDQTGMLKLLFHTETHEILGVHSLGEGASELIHVGQAVMAHHGTIEYFRDTVFNYPTLAECYKVAALNGLNKL